jgi:hypothetical protein
MRGWIYVASARGDPGRVWIGHSSVDPLQASGRVAEGELQYDVVVDAPHAAVDVVHARLRPLRAVDGRFRCSPEFAIAAIHHALGGPPAGERVYARSESPPAEPAPQTAPPRSERGGTPASLAVTAAGTLAAIVLAGWMAVRGGAPPTASGIAPTGGTVGVGRAGPSAGLDVMALEGSASKATAAAAPVPTAEDLAVTPFRDSPGSNPSATARDCAALESLLVRCSARRGRACEAGTAGIAPQDRRVMAEMREAGRPFDVRALENFCRAACRHGYRPARADFVATVCRDPP